MSDKVGQSDPGAVILPSADGYHFGDDYSWGIEDQKTMIQTLWSAAAPSCPPEPGRKASAVSPTDSVI
jgi:hypothetical protein